jgi:hypothetical protein
MIAGAFIAASLQVVAQDGQAVADKDSSPFPRIAYDERAWKPLQSTQGGFVISFPGKPGFQAQTVQGLANPVVNNIHGLDIGVAFFAATYTEMPVPIAEGDKELINGALDAGRDNAVKGARGQIISEKSINLNGHHMGRDLVYSIDGGALVRTKSYLANNRLYQLMVISEDYRKSTAEDQKFYQGIINRFFDSFKLTQKTQ